MGRQRGANLNPHPPSTHFPNPRKTTGRLSSDPDTDPHPISLHPNTPKPGSSGYFENEQGQQCRFFESLFFGVLSPDKKFLYHFGIIDSLTEYTFRKTLEYSYNQYLTFNKDFSCIPPDRYGARFMKFMKEVIKPPE